MARIVLAEDDVPLAMIYRKWLEAEGHTVEYAEDGGIGLDENFVETPPDLLITDILMPAIDGEALSMIFGLTDPTRPILVVTALTEGEKLDRLRNEPQVKQILHKPITREQLLDAVETWLPAGSSDAGSDDPPPDGDAAPESA